MASRTGINIYTPKYFMAVRSCINIFVLGLKVLYWHIPYKRTFYIYVRKILK